MKRLIDYWAKNKKPGKQKGSGKGIICKNSVYIFIENK